jgi:hypothetical protein
MIHALLTCKSFTPGTWPSAWLLALALCAAGSGAAAQQNAVAINDADPESSVPSQPDALKNPLAMSDLVMELAARAERAQKEGRHAQAALYHRALGKAVPSRATGFAAACREHDQAGERDEALEACRAALGKEGVTVEDSARFVRLILQSKGPLRTAEIADIDAVLDHLEAQIGNEQVGRLTVVELRCQVAVRLEDLGRLKTCVKEMQAMAPSTGQAFVYASMLALKEKDWDEAQRILARAKQAGLPPAAIELMEDKFSAHERLEPSNLGAWSQRAWLFGVPAAALLLGFAWLVRRRAERRAA